VRGNTFEMAENRWEILSFSAVFRSLRRRPEKWGVSLVPRMELEYSNNYR